MTLGELIADMSYANPEALVSTAWLHEHLAAPDIHVVDASWFFEFEGRDAKAEFTAHHIPGARFFDIDEICDSDSPLPPHAAESGEVLFARAAHGPRRWRQGRGL